MKERSMAEVADNGKNSKDDVAQQQQQQRAPRRSTRGHRHDTASGQRMSTSSSSHNITLTEHEIIRIKENERLTELCPAATLVLRKDTKDREIEAKKEFLASLHDQYQGTEVEGAAVVEDNQDQRRRLTLLEDVSEETEQHHKLADVDSRSGGVSSRGIAAPKRVSRKSVRSYHSRVVQDGSSGTAVSGNNNNKAASEDQIATLQEHGAVKEICPAATLVLRQDTKEREMEARKQFADALINMEDVSHQKRRLTLLEDDNSDQQNQYTAATRLLPEESIASNSVKNNNRQFQSSGDIALFKAISKRSRDNDNFGEDHLQETPTEAYQNTKSGSNNGLMQPGAYADAPGVRPSRLQSVRFSVITDASSAITAGSLATSSEAFESTDDDDCDNDNIVEGDLPRQLPDAPIKSSNASTAHPSHRFVSLRDRRQGDEEAPPVHDDDRNAGLAQARAVSSSEQNVLAAADELDPDVERLKRENQWLRQQLMGSWGCLCLMTILVIVFVVLFLVSSQSGDNNNNNPMVAPTMTPTMAPTPYPLPLLESTIQQFETQPNSSQARAYVWLKDDPAFDSYNETSLVQRFALATLYYSTMGSNWTINANWLSYNHSECDWATKWVQIEGENTTGVCDDNGIMTTLLLTKNNLVGTLPPELGMLTLLEELNVATNDIMGTIPTQIGLMRGLKQLVMDINTITGTMPTEVGQLSQLEVFSPHSNALTGTMPTELGLMTSMIEFQWANTETGGGIPSELGLMTGLTTLYLSNNYLEGPLPKEIYSLTSLTRYLAIDLNFLNGTLGTEIGLLTNLKQFYGDANSFSGSLPTELGQLTSMLLLILNTNDFTGQIPSQVGQLSNLWVWSGYSMGLTGTIPSELGLLTDVYSVDFDFNALTGSLPPQLLDGWGSVEQLYLTGNQISGILPSQIGNMRSLEGFWIDGNLLSGTLPTQMALLENMTALAVNDNPDLHGTIPEELTDLVDSLGELFLYNTLLSGTIPWDLCSVPDLIFNCSDILCGCSCPCMIISGTTTHSNNSETTTLTNKTQGP